jgi:hypothetical protein
MSDARPDELLEECGRIAGRLGLAIAWTDSINGAGAKAVTGSGSASWKNAKQLPAEPQAAAAFFKTRARKRNPAVVASRSRLVLVESDDGDLDELCERHGLPPLPASVRVRSRRGVHAYGKPPNGYRGPLKIQLSPDGVIASSDGYLIAAGALHPTGHVYAYEGGVDEITVLARGWLEEAAMLGREARAWADRALAEGDEIPKGQRNETLFHLALQLIRQGAGREDALARLLDVNRVQCRPPLDLGEVRKQVNGAARWAARHPTVEEELRARARQVLDESRSPPRARRTRGRGSGLFLPFVDVRLSGPPRWLWRGKVPEGAVTLLAGRPKLGKSLFAVWLAAQLSRGLLPGDHLGTPARTLIIAAEDPVDTIVKSRLVAAAADEAFVGTLASRPPSPPTNARGNRGGLDGLDGAGAVARRVTIPDEYELLEQLVVENAVALVVLDPINSFITHKVDAHRDAEIRRVLDPLAALAARRHFSALAVVHLNRRSDTDVLNRITGSGGYGGSARSILTFGRHPENDAQRVVAAEGNWQKEARSDLFEIKEVVVFPDADPDDQTQPALVHVGATDLDSSDLIDQLGDDRSTIEEAKDYLLGELALGPVPVADLRRGAEANGLSWRTVERAKKLLGIEARRISGAGSPRGAGRWEWFLELIEDDQQQEGGESA